MNADEVHIHDDEQIIDEEFHCELDEDLLQELVLDDILEPAINANYPDMESDRAPAGQQDPQRMVVVYLMRQFP